MTARELRRKYLAFFESKGHSVYPSGSLIPYDVTGRLDESLLFNGAGMVQFKPFFRGVAEPPNRQLTTAQKCVRTGDIESVGDLTHLTFFEMLGNFSFGDYFKEEAIAYSWEFLISSAWLGLDPRRLAFTVFREDDEAYEAWAGHVRGAGLIPEHKIFRLGEDTNYWPAGSFTNGPPGPCGPNSEMFYWTGATPPPEGSYSAEDYRRDEDQGFWLEIWNDVFIQYEWQGEPTNPERPSDGYRKTGMPTLPFRSVDTGMGLERTTAVLNGFRSVYDTDVFRPIVETITRLGELVYGQSEERDRAIRIVADHIRNACFCIADGILPGNSGRGYVLRRLIRRAVLKGQRTLGFELAFFHRVFEGVLMAMGDHYRELGDRATTITETLRVEEDLFRRTVSQGTQLLLDGLRDVPPGQPLSGETAFRLYDTFGFPLEVTQEICSEQGLTVDLDGYDRALKEAQERSRGAHGMDHVYGGVVLRFDFGGSDAPTPTRFTGYHTMLGPATIVGVMPGLSDDGQYTGQLALALDETPFYAESGGQVSDVGDIVGEGFSLRVIDLVKQDGVYVHLVEPQRFDAFPNLEELQGERLQESVLEALFNQPVIARVDMDRRVAIMRNHTATHLLHAALREVLGKHVTQAGSLVAPDHLRFDFTHYQAMTSDEVAAVERLINEQALLGMPVTIHTDMPIDEAKARGAMALFGEKYGDRVRMVEIGEFSRELCGGVHVGQSSEVGLVKIVHEGSAASGVRRIEAVSGLGAYDWVLSQSRQAREAGALLKANPGELVEAIERLQDQLREERRKRERLEAAMARGEAGGAVDMEQVGPFLLLTRKFEDIDQKVAASAVDDTIAQGPNRVALVAIVAEGKCTFICKAGPEAVAQGAHAGNIVREVAKMTGGGGGGRADFATAGGKDLAHVDAALAAGRALLESMAKI